MSRDHTAPTSHFAKISWARSCTLRRLAACLLTCERTRGYASIEPVAMRVGIDLVAVETVSDALREHGDRYLDRIYTQAEVRQCRTPHGLIHARLAARFAAKEATIKVLRPVDEPVPWRSIELVRDHSGRVELALSGRAEALAAIQGLQEFAVSVSHEAGFATAVVIAHAAT